MGAIHQVPFLQGFHWPPVIDGGRGTQESSIFDLQLGTCTEFSLIPTAPKRLCSKHFNARNTHKLSFKLLQFPAWNNLEKPA